MLCSEPSNSSRTSVLERPLTGGQDSMANMKVIDAVYEASSLGVRH